jgi:putative peptidoglycan lipid II flippase
MVSQRLAGKLRVFGDSASGRIFAATILVAGLSTLVIAITLLKEILIAHCLGTSDALDAFYVAFLLPRFLISIITSSGNAAFIPTYLEVQRREGIEAARRLFSSFVVSSLVLLCLLSFALAIAQRWVFPVIAYGFAPNKLALTRLLFFILLVSTCLSGLNAVWRAVLNAHERFALTAIAPIASPVVIAVLLITSRPTSRVYALTFGSVLGTVGELVIAGYGLRGREIPLIPRWHGLNPALKRAFAQTWPATVGSLLMGSTVLVDQAMAASLGPGSVSALNYANKILSLVLAIGLASLSTAILPAFSQQTAGSDWSSMRAVLSTYRRGMLLVASVLTVLLVAFSRPIVGLILQGGAFSAEDADLVARVQMLLVVQLPFYATGILYVNAIQALKRNQVLMWGTLISVSLNATLNYLFMKVLGLPGIALSTSVVYAVSFFYLGFMLERVIKEREADMTSEAPVRIAMSVN